MKAIYKKEISSYFNGLNGWLFAMSFFIIFSVSFLQDCLIEGNNDISVVFSTLSTLSMLLVPLLTVQMFTMEKKQNTWIMLMASPVDAWGIVLGKYLAAVTVAAATVAATWLYGAVLAMYTTLFIGELIINQIGLFLLFQAFIAVGEFISSITKRRLTAAVITIIVQLIMLIISLSSSYMDVSVLRGMLKLISPYTSYSSFPLGIFSFSGAFSLLAFSAICLILTARYVEYGRIKGS